MIFSRTTHRTGLFMVSEATTFDSRNGLPYENNPDVSWARYDKIMIDPLTELRAGGTQAPSSLP